MRGMHWGEVKMSGQVSREDEKLAKRDRKVGITSAKEEIKSNQ